MVVLFFRLFFYLKKIRKHWKFSKRQKYFILCLVLFFLRITWIMISLSWFRTCLTLWRNLNSMCYISAKLFLILCEYVLVCTCTQGLIDISCLCTLYNLVKHCHALHLHCSFNIMCVFCFWSLNFLNQKDFCVLNYFSWIWNQGWPYYLYITCLCTLFSLHELLLLHFTSWNFVVHVVWEDVYNFWSHDLNLEVTCVWLSDLNLWRKA